MKRYSAMRVLREGIGGHRGWTPLWRKAELKSRYDVIIIGGGGQGLATAYYLAKNHGIRNVAVLERSWIGSGNTGRNTTVVRSNYYHAASVALYDFSLRLYESLSRDLNYNIMFSQRGVITLLHNRHMMEAAARWLEAMRLNRLHVASLTKKQIAERVPILDVSESARFPVWGGLVQERAGTVRHDAVVWGYARAASALGVDIVEECEVTGIKTTSRGLSVLLETSKGLVGAENVVVAAAGHSSALAGMMGFRLPIISYGLQAFVSDPVKPILNTVVISTATGIYLNQSDRGGIVIGGPLDRYPSFAQRGSSFTALEVLRAVATQFPPLKRLRLLRQWAGSVDVTPDSSPLLGESPVPRVFLNCGWGTGGFKAIPAGGWLSAYHVANGEQHPIAMPFNLNRFERMALIDEVAASGISH